MWTPIKLTDKATGRSVYISIFEREMYLSGSFSFEDLWAIHQPLNDFGLSVSDVLCVRPDLTTEQGEDVLQRAVENTGAETGVDADVLELWANCMYPRKDNGEGRGL